MRVWCEKITMELSLRENQRSRVHNQRLEKGRRTGETPGWEIMRFGRDLSPTVIIPAIFGESRQVAARV